MQTNRAAKFGAKMRAMSAAAEIAPAMVTTRFTPNRSHIKPATRLSRIPGIIAAENSMEN